MREVVVVSAVRSAIGKAGRGGFKDTRPDTLLSYVLAEAVRRAGVDPKALNDVVIGTAMPEAEQGMNVARIAALMAGLPNEVPAVTVNRFCSSGRSRWPRARRRSSPGGRTWSSPAASSR
jgi:acetyl-CoA acyltransferase